MSGSLQHIGGFFVVSLCFSQHRKLNHVHAKSLFNCLNETCKSRFLKFMQSLIQLVYHVILIYYQSSAWLACHKTLTVKCKLSLFSSLQQHPCSLLQNSPNSMKVVDAKSFKLNSVVK